MFVMEYLSCVLDNSFNSLVMDVKSDNVRLNTEVTSSNIQR